MFTICKGICQFVRMRLLVYTVKCTLQDLKGQISFIERLCMENILLYRNSEINICLILKLGRTSRGL